MGQTAKWGVGGDQRREGRKPYVGLLLAERRRRGQRRGAEKEVKDKVCQLHRIQTFYIWGTKIRKGSKQTK